MSAEVATTWVLLFWVRATVILLLGGAFALLLRRSSSSARHAVLGFTVAALLVLPIASIAPPGWEIAILPGSSPRTGVIRIGSAVAESAREVPARRSPRVPTPGSGKATAAVTAPTGGELARSDVRDERTALEGASSRPRVGSALAWLAVAWLVGAAIGVVQICRSSLLVQRTLRRALELTESGWQDELDQAARTLGLQRRVRLLMSDAVRVPVVHGFRRPAIVMPTSAAQWPEDRRRAFLLHELAHVRRQDWPTQMLGHLARALYWPHPIVWWVVRRLRAEAERASDDYVLLGGTSASDYADHLLQAARDLGRTPQQETVVAAVERSYFEDRLIALLDPQVSRRALGPRMLAFAAVAALAVVVGLAGLQPVARVLAAAPERAASRASVSEGRPSPAARTTPDPGRPARSTNGDASRPGASTSRRATEEIDSAPAPEVAPASSDEPADTIEAEEESEESVVPAASPIGQAVPLPQPSATPAAIARPVIRISTDLVQIDAVITDKDGKSVVDLRPEDFEVFEDGKKQNVTHLRYVAAGPSAGAGVGMPTTPSEAGEPRNFVFVIDNLGLSLEGTARARKLVQSFVTKSLQPRDRAAIIETSARSGGTFALTSDPQLLSEAAGRIHHIVWGRAGLGSFGGRQLDLTSRHDQLVLDSLAVLKTTIDGLRALPGRKSVILVSDGLTSRISIDMDRLLQRFTATPLDSLYGDTSLHAALRALTDLANRASVVIYTLDSTGLQASGSFGGGQRLMTGSIRNQTNTATVGDVRDDDGLLVTGNSASRDFLVRSAVRTTREDSLIEIAEQTGGLAVFSTNDLRGGLARIVDDLSGYYLIGYVPDSATFGSSSDQPRFHEVKVEVKRGGLKVRSRKGFYGVTDEVLAQAAPPK